MRSHSRPNASATPDRMRAAAMRAALAGLGITALVGLAGCSPAATAGLAQNDVIVTFDGTAVEDQAHLQRLSADTEVGRTVKLEIVRKRERRAVDLTVAEAPDTTGPATRRR